MKKFFILLLIIAGHLSFAQNYKITYKTFFEGKENTKQDPIIVFTNEKETFLLTENILNSTKDIPFEIQKIDRADQTVSQFAFLLNNQISEYQNKETLQKQKI